MTRKAMDYDVLDANLKMAHEKAMADVGDNPKHQLAARLIAPVLPQVVRLMVAEVEGGSDAGDLVEGVALLVANIVANLTANLETIDGARPEEMVIDVLERAADKAIGIARAEPSVETPWAIAGQA